MGYRWNRKSRMMLLDGLASYISAGLTMRDALRISVGSFPRGAGASLSRVIESVERGHMLSKALRAHAGFSSALASMIEHGERSGDIVQSLSTARSIIEREDSLVRSLLSAMAYPSAIGAFACVITIGLMHWVMPQIIPMLKGLHAQLPLLTRAVMYVSEHMMVYSIAVVSSCAAVIPGCVFMYKKTRAFKSVCHQAMLHIPVVSNVCLSYNISIILRSMGGLISSGVGLPEAYDSVTERTWLMPLKERLVESRADIHRGVVLSSACSRLLAPFPYARPIISAGEASGTLGRSLVRIADAIDKDVEHYLKRASSLIEPIMMVGIGCIVGSIALSIMLPIYEISKTLQH